MIKLHLDPRTKLFMIFAVSFIVMVNAVSPMEWTVRIIVTLIPVFLLANEGRYLSALRFLLCYGAALLLLKFYISSESTGVLSAFLVGYCGIVAQFMPAMIMAWYVIHTTKMHNCYMIMQDVNHQLFTESVRDEVILSMTDKSLTDEQKAQKADEILVKLDLAEYADTHPMALSGGQKQRTAVASGIASSKPIIIFDEPTSGLDLAHMKQVSDQLKKLRDMGKTVIVVTHDNEFILSCCDHVVRLENGCVAENCLIEK